MMNKILTAAILDGYSRRKDKSVSVRFITQEMTSSEIQNIDILLDQYGFLYFQPGDAPNQEMIGQLESIPSENSIRKTPSQRLRNTLYVYWKDKGLNQSFETFYAQEMENYINQIKRRL